MKVFYKSLFPATVLLLLSTLTYAQHHYVIVGAFAIESNAQKFTGYVRSHHYDGAYEEYVSKKLFYVYVLKTENREEAFGLAKHLQSDSEFKDCWVFKGTLGNESEVNQFLSELTKPAAKTDSVQAAPISDDLPTKIDSASTPATTVAVDSASSPPVTAPAVATTVSTPNAPNTAEAPMTVKGKLFRFAIELPDGKPLHGEVHHVDFNRGRDLASYKGNQYVDLLNPTNHNPMSIVCGIFGYKEVVHVIDYTDPSHLEGAMQDERGAWVIPFKLERMKKGDISVMYHVSFYKDAVVMLPASKTELDELVNMMTDNPEYKIKIHGHCNGNNSRRIIALGETANYFDVKGSREIKGTAKDLSKMRAEAVQSYLTDHGIDRSRAEVYGWAAANMLVDEHSTSAKLNDRIEIEILED